MATFSIVEHLDVLEQICLCLFPGSVANAVDTFAFEHPEEAFDDRIVVAVRGRAHAAFDAMASKLFAEVVAGVLGGFNRSSQHPVDGGCHGETEARIGMVQ